MKVLAAGLAGVALIAGTTIAAQTPAVEPLAVARILAGKYPAQPSMSYIPALTWSSSFRLSGFAGSYSPALK